MSATVRRRTGLPPPKTNISGAIDSIRTGIVPSMYTELRTVHGHDLHEILSMIAYTLRGQPTEENAQSIVYLCKEIISTYMYKPQLACLKSLLTACINRATQSLFEEGAFLDTTSITAFYDVCKSIDLLRKNIEHAFYMEHGDINMLYSYLYTLMCIVFTETNKVRYASLYNLVVGLYKDTERLIDFVNPELHDKLPVVLLDPIVMRLQKVHDETSGMTESKWLARILVDAPVELHEPLKYLFKGFHKSPFRYIFTFAPTLLARAAPDKCQDPDIITSIIRPVASAVQLDKCQDHDIITDIIRPVPPSSDPKSAVPEQTPELDIASIIEFCETPAAVFPTVIYTHSAHLGHPKFNNMKHEQHAIKWDHAALTPNENTLLEIYTQVDLFHEKDI